MRIEIRSHRAWYGRKRWRWYFLSNSGAVISYSASSYAYNQQAWEAAQDYFGAGVTMVDNRSPYPEEHFELYAGPRDWE